MNQKFGKEYKLCNKRIIDEIFNSNQHLKSFPFVLKYIQTTLKSNTNFQVVISVPKRKFKKAVDRNRIRRIIREAIRKNKYIIESVELSQNQKFALFLIYTSDKEESYQTIFDKIELLFKRLVDTI
ncbi:MAG: ribonuclease P protein component [Brumimicrobium sp.]